MSSRVIVVAAVIWNLQRNRLLISLRKLSQHQGGLWEFPGGKVEVGESHFCALKRELLEEINIEITQAESWQQIEHDYADKSVLLDFWQVTAFRGDVRSLENQTLAWVAVSDLNGYDFPTANQPVVERILEEFVKPVRCGEH